MMSNITPTIQETASIKLDANIHFPMLPPNTENISFQRISRKYLYTYFFQRVIQNGNTKDVNSNMNKTFPGCEFEKFPLLANIKR